MEKLKLLIKVSRPIGWLIAPIVFFGGLTFSNTSISIISLIQLLLLSFPYCILLYGINDVYDYKSDKNNPRKKLLEGIKLNPKYHLLVKKASLIVAFLLIVSSLLTFNLINILAMLILIFISVFYSAPPLRFKVHPPLDSISNGIVFFLLFWLGYSFGASFLPLKIYYLSLSVIGVHAFSTIMDYKIDKKLGDRTFSVVFGKRITSLFALSLFLIIILLSHIQSIIINSFLVFCSILFLIEAIIPIQKLSSLFFKFIISGFLISSIIYFL